MSISPEDLTLKEDQLLVEAYERPDASTGGIIIPEAFRADTTKQLYWVLKVGPGYRTRKGARVPMECNEDDMIWCDPFTLKPIDSIGPKCYIVREREVLGKVHYEEWDPEQGEYVGDPPNADAEPDQLR